MSIIRFYESSDKVYFKERKVKQRDFGKGLEVKDPIAYGISLTRRYSIYCEEGRYLVHVFSTDNIHKKHLVNACLKTQDNLVGHECLFRISKKDEPKFRFLVRRQSEGGIFKYTPADYLHLE